MNQLRKIIILLLVIEIIFLVVFGTYLKVMNPEKRFVNLEIYYPDISVNQIVQDCNMTSSIDKIYCINQVYRENVDYDGCEDRFYTLYPEQAINLNKGCCREAVIYYVWFLTEYKIPFEIVVHPKHILVIAWLEDEQNDLNGYVVLDNSEMEVWGIE